MSLEPPSAWGGRLDRGNLAHIRRRTWAAAVCSLLFAGSCGFPDYGFAPEPGTGGSAGASGHGGANQVGGGGQAGANQGGAGQGGVAGTAGTAGAAGSAGSTAGSAGSGGEGGQVPACSVPRVPLPQTCYDGVKGSDEVGVDCGGASCQRCFTGACSGSDDCTTGCVNDMCQVEVKVDYDDINAMDITQTPQFRLRLVHANSVGALPASDFTIRYYLSRAGAVEPILVTNIQALVHRAGIDTQLSDALSWKVVRVAAEPGDAFDAYLELRALSNLTLSAGDYFEVYLEIVSGAGGSFDQRTHYSRIPNTSGMVESSVITVHRGDELIWGYEPSGGGQPSCFHRAVNLNGGEVDIDGETWQSGSSASIATTGTGIASQSSTLTPGAADPERAEMLRSAFELTGGEELHLPVDNGSYLVFIETWSGPSGDETGQLIVEGMTRDSFKSSTLGTGRTWATLGPYEVEITDESLDLGVGGGAGDSLRLSGVQLRIPAEAQ